MLSLMDLLNDPNKPQQLPPVVSTAAPVPPPDNRPTVGSMPTQAPSPIPSQADAPPPPTAAPMPGQDSSTPTLPSPTAAPSAPPSQERPSLLGRIGHALMAGEHGVTGPEPSGYNDLLNAVGASPDERASARPSFLHWLIGTPDAPSYDQRYRQNLDALVQRKQAGIAMQQQSGILAARRSVMDRFPVPQSGSEEDVAQWSNKVLPFLMASGDYEGVKALQPLADQFAKNLHTRPYEPQLFQSPDGTKQKYFDPSETTSIPDGWRQVMKPSASGQGAPQIFRGMKDGKVDYVGIAPGDSQAMATYSKLGYKPEVTARTEFVQGQTQNRFDATDVGKQVTAFNTLNSPLTKAATFYPGFKAASAEALAGNPAAFKTLMSQMAAQLDPALQLRLGTLMYVQNIDPSFKGSLQRYLSEKASGSLPPAQVQKVIKIVNAVRGEQRDLYEKRRSDLVSNFPAADKYARSTDDVFGAAGDTAAAKPDVAARDGQLKGQGLDANARRAKLKQEGYNVR